MKVECDAYCKCYITKRVKEAFHNGLESWVRRLRFDDRSGGPDGGGGLGGGSDRALAA